MKTQYSIYEKQQEKNSRSERILLGMILFCCILLLIVCLKEVYETPRERIDKLKQEKAKQVSVYDEWVDNFDSTYVFNGCIHYTYKSI